MSDKNRSPGCVWSRHSSTCCGTHLGNKSRGTQNRRVPMATTYDNKVDVDETGHAAEHSRQHLPCDVVTMPIVVARWETGCWRRFWPLWSVANGGAVMAMGCSGLVASPWVSFGIALRAKRAAMNVSPHRGRLLLAESFVNVTCLYLQTPRVICTRRVMQRSKKRPGSYRKIVRWNGCVGRVQVETLVASCQSENRQEIWGWCHVRHHREPKRRQRGCRAPKRPVRPFPLNDVVLFKHFKSFREAQAVYN